MKRTRKKPEERRKEILIKSEQLFVEKGYANVTIDEITKAVGVARTTFYDYYSDKINILVDIIDAFVSANDYAMPSGDTTYEKLVAVTRDVFTMIVDNKDLYSLLLREAPVLSDTIGIKLYQWRQAREKIILAILEEGTEMGEISKELSLEDSMFIYLSMLSQRSGDLLLNTDGFMIEEEAQRVVRLAWRAIQVM